MCSQKNKRFKYSALARHYSIWITSRRCASFQGWIVHQDSGSRQYFESLLEMVSLVDDKLEELSITRLASEKRCFTEKLGSQCGTPDKRKEDRHNSMENIISFEKPIKKPEFLVKILMRQNSSWQGEVRWLNSDQAVHFRSMLELVLLIQEAMDISGEPEADYKFRSWQEDGEAALADNI